ncbi:MAG: hypothetical protein JWO03_3392 [Bacteroidetes bacterium]|nr:hypothetical protein [Bacteroidota bacterium]
MIKQAYIRYKQQLNKIVEETFSPAQHLNDVGVVSFTLTAIVTTLIGYLQVSYSVAYFLAEWKMGYITL